MAVGSHNCHHASHMFDASGGKLLLEIARRLHEDRCNEWMHQVAAGGNDAKLMGQLFNVLLHVSPPIAPLITIVKCFEYAKVPGSQKPIGAPTIHALECCPKWCQDFLPKVIKTAAMG